MSAVIHSAAINRAVSNRAVSNREVSNDAKAELIEQIREVLGNSLNFPHMEAFSPGARLNEDLYLDSVMILQLLLHLELEHGYEVPDEALTKDAFSTVEGLATFMLSLQSQDAAEQR